MPSVRDTPESAEAIRDILTRHYAGRIQAETADALVSALELQDAEAVMAALDAHILDDTPSGREGRPVGHWPPSAAQIVGRIHAAERASQASQEGRPARPQGREVWVDLDAQQQRWTGLGPRVRTWTSECMHCSDTGWARFYTTTDEKRVWLGVEAVQLPQALFDRLRCQLAICWCQAGQERPERTAQTTVWHRGREITVPVYPRLTTIKRLSACRQAREEAEIGASSGEDLSRGLEILRGES